LHTAANLEIKFLFNIKETSIYRIMRQNGCGCHVYCHIIITSHIMKINPGSS